jgi:hypothetical protein
MNLKFNIFFSFISFSFSNYFKQYEILKILFLNNAMCGIIHSEITSLCVCAYMWKSVCFNFQKITRIRGTWCDLLLLFVLFKFVIKFLLNLFVLLKLLLN